MPQKLIITFSVLLYAIGVPYLELNSTHVFNPDWTPHVRIHEVWQLITNSTIGALCIWMAWVKKKTLLGSVLSLIVTGGFLISFALQDTFGGSMKYLDGSEKTLLGVNIGVVGFGLVVVLLIASIITELRGEKMPEATAD